MKYAVVDTHKAEVVGLKKTYHVLNHNKTKMIVNENELKKLGDPQQEAEKLGGELLSRKELNNIINSAVWHKQK